MILTGLVFNYFVVNLYRFPIYDVIHVSKEDVLTITSINFFHEYTAVNLTSQSTPFRRRFFLLQLGQFS